MFKIDRPSTIAELWRIWTWLEEAELAVPEITDGRPGSDDWARQEYQSALCAEIQELRDLARTMPVRSFADVAALLDMVIEYEVELHKHPDDRLGLQHLVSELRRLAPEVAIGAISRMERRQAS